MAYLALYREWRPQTFREVVGQEHITRTLVNALRTGRVAHAYLFCGPRGTGKTSTAKVLARALNCLEPDGVEPCGRCGNCLEIQEGTSMDVIEIDAASNRGIDEVRELRENIKFSPTTGSKRVYIIDEVHMLTDPAFNALLKTLEEPPSHAVFILATTEPHKVPLTILSRCQRFDFHRIPPAGMEDRLRQVAAGAGIELEDAALELMVRAADGGLRDALSILDQAGAFGEGRVTAGDVHRILGTVRGDVLEEFYNLLSAGRAGECLALVGDIAEKGVDLRLFARELTAYARGLMLNFLSPGEHSTGQGEAKTEKILEVLQILARVEQDMRWSTQPRVLLEVALVRSARVFQYSETLGAQQEISGLATRVAELEGLVVRLGGAAGQFPGSPKDQREEESFISTVPAGTKKKAVSDKVTRFNSGAGETAMAGEPQNEDKIIIKGDGKAGKKTENQSPGETMDLPEKAAAGPLAVSLPEPPGPGSPDSVKPALTENNHLAPVSGKSGKKGYAPGPGNKGFLGDVAGFPGDDQILPGAEAGRFAGGKDLPDNPARPVDPCKEDGMAAEKTRRDEMALDKVTGRWDDIKNTMGRAYPNIYSYLTMGKGGWPAEVSGNTLTIAFWEKDSSSVLAVAILNDDTNKNDFQQMIKSICQEDLRVRFILSPVEPPSRNSREEKPATPDEASGLFDGEEQTLSEDLIFDE